MNSAASAALSSAENTAARPSVPTSGRQRRASGSSAAPDRASASCRKLRAGDHAEQRPARSRTAAGRARCSRRRAARRDRRARRTASAAARARRRTPDRAAPDRRRPRRRPTRSSSSRIVGAGIACSARPAADRRQRQRQRDREADQLHRELHHVDPRARRQSPPADEVDRDQRRRRSMQPSHFGAPATTFRIDAIAISCPARIASEPNHSSRAMMPRTLGP